MTQKAPDALADTSVAVPCVFRGHVHRDSVLTAIGSRTVGLAGHAAFETFSVVTRLPGAARLSAAEARRLIRHDFPLTRYLDAHSADQLLDDVARLGVIGGAVYDALVGATAVAHGLPLLSRDRRAAPTYAALGVELELIESQNMI